MSTYNTFPSEKLWAQIQFDHQLNKWHHLIQLSAKNSFCFGIFVTCPSPNTHGFSFREANRWAQPYVSHNGSFGVWDFEGKKKKRRRKHYFHSLTLPLLPRRCRPVHGESSVNQTDARGTVECAADENAKGASSVVHHRPTRPGEERARCLKGMPEQQQDASLHAVLCHVSDRYKYLSYAVSVMVLSHPGQLSLSDLKNLYKSDYLSANL